MKIRVKINFEIHLKLYLSAGGVIVLKCSAVQCATLRPPHTQSGFLICLRLTHSSVPILHNKSLTEKTPTLSSSSLCLLHIVSHLSNAQTVICLDVQKDILPHKHLTSWRSPLSPHPHHPSGGGWVKGLSKFFRKFIFFGSPGILSFTVTIINCLYV